ncbi:diaminopropionate ammonia-lyase [Bacillus sp. ISL-40]|uniref:diaminopropionate ammonia-lyase n=1 Tax=unclassified Bacillus (in: firmicutes) TaxID=185979 RepID=UPI001BE6DF18|nr:MULTISPECIES: diaminopropionate ammonia-lyase [unclassified Bacillus (in: firmicutes)]MBT2701137.1 diaminopropionate ammonia-lyase [Bacillus sp. ISL-40]MBT2739102.1 diaminopropionate ammonia-lyase [Bacillus sp. ISL-77]
MKALAQIKYMVNENARKTDTEKASVKFINSEVAEKVRNFHKSFPEYKVTPLHSLDQLSKQLGVSNIWVKDESYRFGLNAFKVLGGSYAVGKYLAEKLNVDISELSFEKLRSKEVKDKLGDITFVTATDGNHGRGIAWSANELGQKSVVYMPKGSSEIRLNNIRKEGAEASITDLNYDDTVRLASQKAEENGWVLVQDTAWDGYEKIPTWIMQGYGTILDEAVEQITEVGVERPTHVFLQAGVGSFAGSMLGYLVGKFGDERPITVIVEPDNAACLFKSMNIGDGQPHSVTGALNTIMAGLACGEPSTTSWGVLKDYAEAFVSCPDYVAARGMRILANPLGSDPHIISGESGAVGMGLVSLLSDKIMLNDMKEALNLNQDSKILIISTEGDTDPDHYRKVVWDGAYPSI